MKQGTSGTYGSESLPNISGGFTVINDGTGTTIKDAFGCNYFTYESKIYPYTNSAQASVSYGVPILHTDASLSSSTYQNNAKVNPDNAEILYCIKY